MQTSILENKQQKNSVVVKKEKSNKITMKQYYVCVEITSETFDLFCLLSRRHCG